MVPSEGNNSLFFKFLFLSRLCVLCSTQNLSVMDNLTLKFLFCRVEAKTILEEAVLFLPKPLSCLHSLLFFFSAILSLIENC